MPRSRTAKGSTSSTQRADGYCHSEDSRSHSHLYSQPGQITECEEYADYDMAEQECFQEEDQSSETSENWQTHLRSFGIAGPQLLAQAGVTLTPGIVVTVQSRRSTKQAVLSSHASVRLLRAHDHAEVVNGGRSVTGVKVAQSRSSVTMEYRFDDLWIEEAGHFYYDVCVYGMDILTSLSLKILVMWGEKCSEVITTTG